MIKQKRIQANLKAGSVDGSDRSTESDHSQSVAEQTKSPASSEKDVIEQSRRLNETLAALFESAPDAIVTVDADGHIVRVNHRTESMFGYTRAELIGQRVEVLIPVRFKKQHVRHQSSYMAEPRLREMGAGLELYACRKDGSEFPVDIMLSPIDAPDGRTVIATVRDVTARKWTEAQLRKSRQELETRVEERTAELKLANEVLRSDTERLSAIVTIQRELSTADPELRTIMKLVAKQTQKITKANGAAIDLLEDEKFLPYVATGTAALDANLRLRVSSSLAGEVIKRGEILRWNDTEQCSLHDSKVDRRAARKTGTRSAVIAPLVHNGKNVGVLMILSSEPQAFQDRDNDTLQLMAGLVSTAMSNAAEFESEQALLAERTQTLVALESRARQQSAVAELSRRALGARALANLFEDAASTVAKVLDVEFCKILELLPHERSLTMIAGVGWEPEYMGRAVLGIDRDSQGGFALQSGAPVVVENFKEENRFEPPQLFLDHGIVSGVSVIIHGRSSPFGILGAHTRKLRKFAGDDVHFLQSVASVLAAAIERSGLEEELLMISGREQRRIGQDLHDGLCQQLVGIEFRSSVLARQISLAPESRNEVLEIGEMLRNATQQARRLAHGLSPVQMEANGLMSALQGLAENTSNLFKVTCKFKCPKPVLIGNSEVAKHLYRIAQEAIGNAIQHGQAKFILVSLKRLRESITLTINDNGFGFSRDTVKVGGMGLRIMEHRAAMIGASLTIHSKPQSGTEITCKRKIDP